MADEKQDRIPMQEFRGSVYRCPECGVCFNTFDYKCPVCALQARVEEMVELGVAACGMPDDGSDDGSMDKINGRRSDGRASGSEKTGS